MDVIREVSTETLIEKVAQELKDFEEISKPEWADYSKTGTHKERPPDQDDWWYTRSASLLSKVYMKGPIGVERLRKYYGGKDKRRSEPESFKKGSGSIIRNSLQQLESAGLVAKTPQGRKITKEGRNFLDGASRKVKDKLEED